MLVAWIPRLPGEALPQSLSAAEASALVSRHLGHLLALQQSGNIVTSGSSELDSIIERLSNQNDLATSLEDVETALQRCARASQREVLKRPSKQEMNLQKVCA
jgi:hypothetical protein